jgi:inositol hexakisphosphate/diphosphoinositol-pentakisphosphate kinase
MRHGDRTPKQKMKMEVRHKLFFDFFEKNNGMKDGNLKIKRPSQLQEVLDIARILIQQCNDLNIETLPSKETKSKLLQLKCVLEMYGHFSGINRKVQFKYQPNGKIY